MRIFKTKPFARFARKERIEDMVLREAISRAELGLVDAELGGGVIKQRIARQGRGRSGGYRTIIAIRRGSRSVFLYGFSKSARGNIEDDELGSLKEAASFWLSADETQIEREVLLGNLLEIEP